MEFIKEYFKYGKTIVIIWELIAMVFYFINLNILLGYIKLKK